MTIFATIVEQTSRSGPQHYAAWKQSLFQEFCDGPAQSLWQRIAHQQNAAKVFEAYMKMAAEAIGRNYIQKICYSSPSNFLELCFVKWLPESLEVVTEKEQLALMIRIWNVAEGLLAEPTWLNRYIVSHHHQLPPLSDLENFLVTVLEPVLKPLACASWNGPFAVSILNTCEFYDKFLPGEMYLAAPNILCINDRCHRDIYLSLLLCHDQQSRLLGLTPFLAEYKEATQSIVLVSFEESHTRISDHTVKLPHLYHQYSYAIVETGFVIVSAVDSQRLWVVETR